MDPKKGTDKTDKTEKTTKAAAAPADKTEQSAAPAPAGDTPAAAAGEPAAEETTVQRAAPKRNPKLPRERNGREDNPKAKALLFRVCEIFGVNPDRDARPKELEAWTYYPGDEVENIPDAVSIVTCGGQKLRMFEDMTVDENTEALLGRIFRVQPGKPGEPMDLPEDLTLPPGLVHGLVTSASHRYPGGYLKSGGKKEAARRAAIKSKK